MTTNNKQLKKSALFYLGDWQVTPKTNTLSRGDISKQLEPKAMDVLLLLCEQQGQVLSADDIAQQCWAGIDMGDNPVHKAINQLRKALDDKPSQPTYIETIRKRGYRIIAALDFPLDEQHKAQQHDWHDASPFPGLVPFEAKYAKVFFGRNEQISALLSSVAQQVSGNKAFCLLLGPSGTGKSSLVNAGLIPALSHPQGYDGIGLLSETTIDFADINQHRLFIDLASALLDWEVNDQGLFDGLSAELLAEQLQNSRQSVLETCVNALQSQQSNYAKPRFLLFIDRLEVLLSSPLFTQNERERFIGLIDDFANSGAMIVISACRNDFYPLVVKYPSLMQGKSQGAHLDLLAPSRSELMQMIRLPAIAANLTWSKQPGAALSLDEILCNDAANNPDSLPMLQYTLHELYLQRSHNNELQESVYLALGGIEGAIGKQAEEIFLQLPNDQQAELDYILSLVVTLHPDGETITSRAARVSQLAKPSQQHFVQAMVDHRLFVSHLQNNEACFSLSHEALLRRWPRASQWISHHKESLAIKSRLQLLTQRWINEEKSNAFLLSEGKPLHEALSLQHSQSFTLEPNEQALISSSLKRVKAKRWATGATIMLLCLLTFTSVLMSIKSQESQNIAQQKRQEAESLLGFMVGEFADKLRSVKRMDLLDGISNKALEYFSQQDEADTQSSLFSFISDEQNFKSRFQHAQTLGALGEVAYSRGKNDEAQQAFKSAKVILDNLYKQQADNLELLKTLGANVFWLGQLAYDQNDFTQAQPYFELYRDYSENMIHVAPQNLDARVELYNSLSVLGTLYFRQQHFAAAKSAFQQSLIKTDQLLTDYPEDELIQSDKADAISWLATIEQHMGNFTATLTLMKQGQDELAQALKSDGNNASLLERLAYSHWLQATYFSFKQADQLAFDHISQAMQIINTVLQQDPNNQVWQSDLLTIRLTKLLYANKLGLAEDPTFLNQLSTDNYAQMHQMPASLNIIIRFYQTTRNWIKSGDFIRYAQQHHYLKSAPEPETAKDILFLAQFKLLKASQLFHQNAASYAIDECNDVIRLMDTLLTKSRSIEYLVPYVEAHYCIGRTDKVIDEINALNQFNIAVNADHFFTNPTEKKENKSE